MDANVIARQMSGRENYFLIWSKTVLLLLLLGTLEITSKFAVGQNLKIIPKLNSNFVDTVVNLNDRSFLVKAIIPGNRPHHIGKTKSTNILPPTAYVLDNVPAFTWSFGCLPTAGAMLAGYYDRTQFPNMYTGPTNNGICPMDNLSWGFTEINGSNYAVCPLSATMMGVDGRTERGHIDDYWTNYNNNDPDPYIKNGWTQHEYADCTADFMKTSQSEYENPDGTTTFWFFDNGQKLNFEEDGDGAYGLKLFFESRGYSVSEWFTQTLSGYNGFANGFKYVDYKNEINEGRPVLLHLTGHTIIGIGYDMDSETIYFHNTWDNNTYSMSWAGEYNGMQLFCASVYKLEKNVVCDPPANLFADKITLTSAMLSWEADSNQKVYEILYGETGFAFDNGTVISVEDTNHVVINNLASETSYTFYIRSKLQGYYSNWSAPANLLTHGLQHIDLNTGWNLMSVRLMPDSANLKNILQKLIDEGNLIKVMDESGNTIENWGVSGGWQNTIGNLQNSEGYKVNVAKNASIEIEGVPVQFPYKIELKQGWNIISWPSPYEQNAMDVFQSLISKGILKKVIDESGSVIENWGFYGGWQNYIGNFKAGEGYKVNVSDTCTLTIQEIATKSEKMLQHLNPSEHFIPVYQGYGVDHMTINIVDLIESGIVDGDEIGIFDGDLCVGSARITYPFIFDNKISIPVSGNDGIVCKNGYTNGNPVTIRLFRNNAEYSVSISPLKNNKNIFTKGSTLFAEIGITTGNEQLTFNKITEVKCYPNPFSDMITIELNLNEQASVQIVIYNQLGQLAKTILQKDQLLNGLHIIKWNGCNANNHRATPGIYYMSISVDNTISHRKIVLQ